jgi:hypothetical protein
VVVALLGVSMLALAAFLRSQQLDRADQYASIFGLFLNLAALVLGLMMWRDTQRDGRSTGEGKIYVQTGGDPDRPLPQPVNEPPKDWMKFAAVDHDRLFGVDEIIARLEHLLCNRDGDWIISLFGAPGAGKTTLAYEAVKRMATAVGFGRIAWVSAKFVHLDSFGEIEKTQRTIVDWRDLLVDVSRQLCFSELGPTHIELELASAINALNESERCLIVIDNLETVQDARMVIAYLERDSIIRPHKVLLTTRRSAQDLGHVRELRWDGLTIPAAREYAEYLCQDDPMLGLTSRDLESVVVASECNPLLIKLIMRLAVFRRLPIDDIIRGIRDGSGTLGTNIGSYLYAESLTALESRVGTEAAVRIMNVFCCRTPGELFTGEEFYRLSRLPDRDEFERAKAAACQLALVRALGGNTRFTVHSLLREFVCAEGPGSAG